MKHLWAAVFVVAGAISVGAGETQPAGTRPVETPATTEPASEVGAKFEVLSLAVSKPIDSDMMRSIYDNSNGQIKAGTVITARMTLTDASIVSAGEPMRVSPFADDRGTDLGNGRQPKRFASEEITQTSVTPDRRSCGFWLYSAKLPAAGAGEIRVKGALPLRVGRGAREFEVRSPEFKLGRKFEVGGLTLMVDGLHGSRDTDIGMSLSSDRPLEAVSRVEHFDAQGKPVPVQVDLGFGRRRDTNRMYLSMSRQVAPASMKVVLFEKVESVQVPVDLTVKAGL